VSIRGVARGLAICAVGTLATGGVTSLASSIAWRLTGTDWLYSHHGPILVMAAFLGGWAGGTTVTAFWPEVRVALAIAGPAIFWAFLFASPNPWLRGMPLAWVESLAAVAGALFGWMGWRQLRRSAAGTK